MVNSIKKIPAGTFVVPMLLSAVLYTLWPSLFHIGGVTEQFMGGRSNTFIIGMLTFSSGVTIDIGTLVKLFKRHGVLLLIKLVISLVFGVLFITMFGQEGILGISALAFVVAISSINPSLYLSLAEEYGDKVDTAAFALTTLFSIPALPLLIYAMSGSGEFDIMPIISTLIPLLLGILLGNLDKGFIDMFAKGVPVLLPILGWNIGQGMNLLEALQSGVGGVILTVLFYLFMIPLLFVDMKLLKNDGIAALSMFSVSGTSASFPFLLAVSNAALIPHYVGATAQVLTAAIITIIITPMLVGKLHERIKKGN